MTDNVRLAKPADAAALLEIYTPSVLGSSISFEEVLPSLEEFAERIAQVLEQRPYLVLERGAEILGFAYATKFRERAAYRYVCEVSVYIAESAHRQGLARRLYGRLFELLRAQGYHSAIAVITEPNPESGALHRGFGFQKVGEIAEAGYKLGRWHGISIWRLGLVSVPGQEPATPRLLPSLIQDGSLARILASVPASA